MSLDTSPAPRRRLWQAVSACSASAGGVLGFCGVAVSAAASHTGGSPLGQTAGTFLLLHAVAVLGLSSLVAASAKPVVLAAASVCLTLGVVLFAGELVLAGFWGLHPFPPAAPIGGGMLLIGWLLVAIGGALWRSRA